MFLYNKKIINKLLILQIFLLLFCFDMSYSSSNSYNKNNFQESQNQSHIGEYNFSVSEYYINPNNSRNIHLKFVSIFLNVLIPWITLFSILNSSQSKRKCINYHNNNLGLFKKLKIILNPKYHRSKYKAYLTM